MSTEVREPSAKYLVEAPYKHTEVGLIPKEWDVLALADIAAIERGKFSARPRNDPKYYGGEFPFIQTGDVTRSCGSISTFTQTLNREGVRVSRLFPKGTLFFTIAANIGDVGIAKFEAACPDSLVAIVPRSGVQKGWLLYELARKKSDFESLASPGAQLNINLEKLRPYLVPVPPEAEQRAIAASLSDVDALISGLEKLIAKKRDLKQAAMQQLLTGQTRLPGFSGEWVVKRLGEICEISMGRTPSRLNPAFWGAGHVWLSIADLHGKVLSSSKEQITPLAASSMHVIPEGTLLMSFKLSIGRLCFAGCDLYTNEAICSFNNLLANSDYLYYALSRTDFSLYGKQAVKGYTLNKKSLALVEVALPSDEEQAAIANVLSAMDEEMADLERRLSKTRDLKQGMMQELLTGRTRLV
jgi:type I restriction enzyme S subunit